MYSFILQYLLLLKRSSFDVWLERNRFSGLTHLAGSFLHVTKRISTSMTTFLLSQKVNTFFGVFISQNVCVLTWRQVHSSSPALLTKKGPLKTFTFNLRCAKRGKLHKRTPHSFQKYGTLPIQSLRISWVRYYPNASNHSLYQIKLFSWSVLFPTKFITTRLSYSGKNFDVNQLPNISISLSPLNSNQTNNLHVSTASDLHQNFSWLYPVQA